MPMHQYDMWIKSSSYGLNKDIINNQNEYDCTQ